MLRMIVRGRQKREEDDEDGIDRYCREMTLLE
jgi:hypothetical protein